MRPTRLLVLAVAGCGAPTSHPPPPIAVPPVASTAVAAPPVAKAPPAKLIATAGENEMRNAAWTKDGLAAVTHTAVWRVRPEDPERVRMQPLSGVLAQSGVIAAGTASNVVAAALEDGSVDLVEDDGPHRTIAADAAHTPVLAVRFSPDQSTLAVTRDGPTWKEQTTFYDVANSAERGHIDGGNVPFDPTGKYVAGRGGVSSIEGKTIWTYREGFFVLGPADRFIDTSALHGSGFMGGDYVARGWFDGHAVYATEREVVLVDPATGQTTKIKTACAPGEKLGNRVDAEHGRVIDVCTSAAFITDLATKTTQRVNAPKLTRRLTPPEIYVRPEDGSVFVSPIHEQPYRLSPPKYETATVSYGELRQVEERDTSWCVRAEVPRDTMHCDLPADRADHVVRAKVSYLGLVVTQRITGRKIIDWPARFAASESSEYRYVRGAIELYAYQSHDPLFRLDGEPITDAPEPFPSSSCGAPPPEERWRAIEHAPTFTGWTVNRVAHEYVTDTVSCVCRANGCVTSAIHSRTESPIAFREDGTVLSIEGNSYGTETKVFLHAPQAKKAPRATLAESCIYGGFGPDGQVFLVCTIKDRRTIYELDGKTLAVVAKRAAPPVGRNGYAARMMGADLLLQIDDVGLLVPPTWVRDPTATPRATIFGAASYAIVLENGDARLFGDRERATGLLQCWDGEKLRPYEMCR